MGGEGADNGRYPPQFCLREVRAGREAQSVAEERGGDVATDAFVGGEDGLQVHRLPEGAGFDIFCFQRQTHCLAVCAEAIWVYGQRRQPASMAAPGRFRHEGQAGAAGQCRLIKGEVAATGRHPLF